MKLRVPSLAFALAVALSIATVSSARGDYLHAARSGYWSDASTWDWNGPAVPTEEDVVYVGGGNEDFGMAASATVTLDRDVTVSMLSLGDYGFSGGGVLDLADHHLDVDVFYVGGSHGTGGVTRGSGTFTANLLDVGGDNHLTLQRGDSVNILGLVGGATATTTETGNIIGGVHLGAGTRLTLGADFDATLMINGTGGVLDAAGRDVSARYVELGDDVATILNRGSLRAEELYLMGSSDFRLAAADSVDSLYLYEHSATLGAGVGVVDVNLNEGSVLTTTDAGNITGSAYISNNSKLVLGADLIIGADGSIGVDGVLDAAGHGVTADQLHIGAEGLLLNAGAFSTSHLSLTDGAAITMDGSGGSTGQLQLSDGATLTLLQKLGETTGFTLDGLDPTSLDVDDASTLALVFLESSGENWLFRWLGSHVDVLETMIADGRITIESSPIVEALLAGRSPWPAAPSTSGYEVVERDGYTYIMKAGAPAAVPEPASIAMLGVGAVVGLGAFARRRAARRA